MRDRQRRFEALARRFSCRAISEAGHGNQHAQQRREPLRHLLPEEFVEGAVLRGGQPADLRILQKTQRAVSSLRKTRRCRGCSRSGGTHCAEKTRGGQWSRGIAPRWRGCDSQARAAHQRCCGAGRAFDGDRVGGRIGSRLCAGGNESGSEYCYARAGHFAGAFW